MIRPAPLCGPYVLYDLCGRYVYVHEPYDLCGPYDLYDLCGRYVYVHEPYVYVHEPYVLYDVQFCALVFLL
tara:strand:+ start:124 stop:336 length:213 start_codon:yes stop_codon:yes gene_type:complete